MNEAIDPEALLTIAEAISKEVEPSNVGGIRATLKYLYYTPEEVTPQSLREYCPTELTERASEVIVLWLRTEGILTDGTLLEPSLDIVFGTAELLATKGDPPENTVVATLPHEDQAFGSSMFEALHENLLAVIKSAKDELILLSPFLSKQAYRRLRPALHTAADNGAELSVITRYLTYGDEAESRYNRDFINHVLDDRILSHRTTCYEYINDETWTTFHAKVVLADEDLAYLGTANITHKGLGENLELGVIFRDQTVNRLSNLMDSLKTSRYLHEVERRDEEFHRLQQGTGRAI